MKSLLQILFRVAVVILGNVGLSAVASPLGEIKFLASQEGVALQGTFNDFVANVKFDPARPDAGMVLVSVDVRSVNTGTPAANELIRSTDFFDANTFPQATFEASEFRVKDAGHYIAKGAFTLKGHTVSVPVTFVTTATPRGRWFDGSFTVSRTSIKVGQGEWADTSTLDDTVQIQFHILQESPRVDASASSSTYRK